MKFTLIASALTLATAAVASPGRCVTSGQAGKLVSRFASMLQQVESDLGDAKGTANAILAPGYTETSDSILSLEGAPLGTVTFSGKQNYINGLAYAQPIADAETLEVLVAGCNKVLWRWQFNGVGSGQYPVKGFSLFTVTSHMQIKTTYLEFNSLAFSLDGTPSGAPEGSDPTSTDPTSTEPSSTDPTADDTTTDDTTTDDTTTDDTEPTS